jgi:hypothetical protein
LKYTVRDSSFAVVSSIKPLAKADPVKPAHRTKAPKPSDWRAVMRVKGGRMKKSSNSAAFAQGAISQKIAFSPDK